MKPGSGPAAAAFVGQSPLPGAQTRAKCSNEIVNVQRAESRRRYALARPWPTFWILHKPAGRDVGLAKSGDRKSVV